MTNKYAIVTDMRRCIGCGSCSVACKLENNAPDQAWYNTINTVGGASKDTPAGEYGSNSIQYQPFQCMHCDTPACTEVCPVGATWKDEETGIVMQDGNACIGCQSCIEACPFQSIGAGVRSYIDGAPEQVLDWPVGNQQAPDHKENTVEKCILCHYRIKKGDVPACVEGCPTRARHFGDLNDPDSEVSKLLASREYEQLLVESGTGPNMYYLK